jgi:hypothetical protein
MDGLLRLGDSIGSLLAHRGLQVVANHLEAYSGTLYSFQHGAYCVSHRIVSRGLSSSFFILLRVPQFFANVGLLALRLRKYQ